MIPAALLCAIVSGCADQQPTGPKLPRIARNSNVAFNRFFSAWSQSYASGPIQMQMFALDTRQNRQYAEFADQPVLSFATANPGRLYIHLDEPDQYCVAPSDYAIYYHDFVTGVRGADPTARFSPAGFAEPNYHCCPPPDDVPQPCWSSMHSIGYADQFYNAYVRQYGVAPPVDEWRFHDFGIKWQAGDVAGWWSRIDAEAAWSVAHGANMVLGSWGLLGWKEPASDYQEHLKQAMGRLMNDPRINEAVYWAYQYWAGELHYLTNADGSLTPEGQTYANPLTDIPTAVTVVDSANGRAKLQWTNTTSAWPAEAEFWVLSPGSNSYVYKSSERVNGPGAADTPYDVFKIGDNVKGRVRYYNVYGVAEWSSFSNAVLMESAAVEPNKKTTKGPLFCFLSKRILSQPCA